MARKQTTKTTTKKSTTTRKTTKKAAVEAVANVEPKEDVVMTTVEIDEA